MSENEQKPHVRSGRAILLAFIGLLAAGLVITLAFRPVSTARADGGGLPTDTPTNTLIPTATRTHTPVPQSLGGGQGGLPFPPTNTSTPIGGGLLLNPQNQIQANPPAVTQAPRSSFSIVSCWPFALVALIIGIIMIVWLSGRVRQGA